MMQKLITVFLIFALIASVSAQWGYGAYGGYPGYGYGYGPGMFLTCFGLWCNSVFRVETFFGDGSFLARNAFNKHLRCLQSQVLSNNDNTG